MATEFDDLYGRFRKIEEDFEDDDIKELNPLEVNKDDTPKWVYVEDKNGVLIYKSFESPKKVWDIFKAKGYTISIKQYSTHSVAFKIY